MGLFPSPRWRVRLLLGGGVLALVLAYLLIAVPPDAPATVREPIEAIRDPIVGVVRGLGREPLSLGLALVGGGYALARLARGRDRPAVAPSFVAEDGPGRGQAPTVDEDLQRELRVVTDWIDDPQFAGQELRSRLREAAVRTVHRSGTATAEEAERAVERGTWTDDRVAAAFLGGEDAPGYPLRHRIRGWLRPDLAFETRFERTVDAVYDRAGEDR